MELVNTLPKKRKITKQLDDIEEILIHKGKKGFLTLKNDSQDLLPNTKTIIYLEANDNIIEKFNLGFTIDEVPVRLYEVELLSEGRQIEYLYKNNVMKIIENRIKSELELNNLNGNLYKPLIDSYENAISKICN